MRNLTIKMRLIATLGIIGALLIAVGAMGIVGMNNANSSLEAMYSRDTVPTEQVAEVQRRLLLNRLLIAVSLVTPTPEEIRKNTAEVEANIAEISKVWDAYMAGPMNEDRKKLAETFAEHRKKFVQQGLRPAIETRN